jgi:hypothetical protein
MKSTLEKSFAGVPPDVKSEIPDFLTKEKTLEVM